MVIFNAIFSAYTSPGQEKGRQYTIDPLDELAEQLGQPSVQTILKTFAPEDKWTLQHYISLLIGPDGTNEYRAMHKVVEFLEKFNIYLVFSTPLPELGNYQVPREYTFTQSSGRKDIDTDNVRLDSCP